VWSVVYSPKGQMATCSVDYSIRLWDVDTGQCLKVLNHASPVVSVIYSPDGKVGKLCVDQSVRIWDAATGECIKILQCHSEWHFSATFDWGGAIVLVPMVKLWRVTVKRCHSNLGDRSTLACTGTFKPRRGCL